MVRSVRSDSPRRARRLSETGTIFKVEQFPGTTADTKLNTCAAATASGGVCDARGFGATQQTIAATVFIGTQSSVNGYNAPYQKFLFSPATAFVPASPQGADVSDRNRRKHRGSAYLYG
jgi:hypothetical protein